MYKSIFMCLLFGTLDFIRLFFPIFFFFRLFKYLMSTNFPLKPIQRSIQLPLFAYTFSHRIQVRKHWLLDRSKDAILPSEYVMQRKTTTAKLVATFIQFWLFCKLSVSVFVFRFCWLAVFDAIPDHR